MAVATHHSRHRAPPLAFTLTWRGKHHTWKIGRASALAIALIAPAILLGYGGSAAYLIFHDKMLAALISRQTDMQYSYEDRIALLRTQLDRQTTQSLVDRQALSTTIRDLSNRSAQLEAHAATIDQLIQDLKTVDQAKPDANGVTVTPVDGPLPPDVSMSITVPPNPSTDRPAGEDHSEIDPVGDRTVLAASMRRLEDQQAGQLARLRDPMLHDVVRMETALAEAGLSPNRWNVRKRMGGVGGPFVPLPKDASTFDQNLAMLQDAITERTKLKSVVASVPLGRPVRGRLEVTSPFGARMDPFFGRPAMHTGMDLMEPYGGAVYATAGGVVTTAGSEGGYGNMVEVDHGNGLTTRYAHLSSIDVAPHQRIAAGALIGRVGATGRATGPHLHYETRIDGEAVDPTRFLRAGRYLTAKGS